MAADQSDFSIFRNETTGILHGYFAQKLRTGGVYNRCTHMELNATECVEAYGQYRGHRYCNELYNDWIECVFGKKAVSKYDD